MIYRQMGDSDVQLSIIGLGGHEYLENGSSRGFNEDFAAAVRPGYVGVGYGGERRRQVLATAFEHGINFLDVTIDPEKEALGRNLKEIIPPYEVYIQTRPEGMGYGYDEHNTKLSQYPLLKAEVERILTLLQRETIDFLNFPFLQAALDHDPEYLAKIADNVAKLKAAGLIRFATADNFSGERTYLAQVNAGCFDALAMNFNIADAGATRAVIPQAQEQGLAVITREVFLKGKLFQMGEEIGVTDRSLLARASLKWNLNQGGVSTALVGAHLPEHLHNCLSVLDDLAIQPDEVALLAQ
ncbi:MAG: aldo/keto reductase [Caldilineaceae bacterium]|nr:aldo/keto reductase [Caldilineaceae bacterium]